MEEIQESIAGDATQSENYFAEAKYKTHGCKNLTFDNNPKDQYAAGCHNLIVNDNYKNANTYFTNAANEYMLQPKQGKTLTSEEQKKRNESFLESNYILGVWNLFGIGKEKAVPQNIQKSINCLM